MAARDTILIVDDEELVTSTLSAFLTLETDYEVVVFNDSEAAARWAETNAVDLIIADYLMPRMNGVDLLRRLRALQPEAVRVMLTGYGHKDGAVQAINEVGLFHYVEKPWDNDALLLIIRNGLERKHLMARLQASLGQASSAFSELQSIQRELLRAFV